MTLSWYRSIPGAICLDFNSNTGAELYRRDAEAPRAKTARIDRRRHCEVDCCDRLECGKIRRLQPCATVAPRGLHERLLVPWRPRGVGGGWQARRRCAASRLVTLLNSVAMPNVGFPPKHEPASRENAGGEVGAFLGSNERLSGIWSGFEHGGSPFSPRRRPSDHPNSFTAGQPAAPTHARGYSHARPAPGYAA